MDQEDFLDPGEHLEDELSLEAEAEELEAEAPNENWLVSYADLMTLLFGFFAMLYLQQMLAPPKPVPPAPEQKQEQKKEEQAKQETPPAPVQEQEPVPPPPPPTAASAQGGGERGFALLNLFPEKLFFAMLAASALYLVLYFLGRVRHRVIVDPVTGARSTGRRAPILQLSPAARRPLTPEQLALKAREDEILKVDDAILLEEPHSDVAHMTDERWLISYADLMTLLFGFFAMLYLMGGNFETVKKSMDQTFTKNDVVKKMPPIEVPKVATAVPPVMETKPVETTPVAETKTTPAPVSTVVQALPPAEAPKEAPPETVVKATPRRTPTREEFEKMEEERAAALKQQLQARANSGAFSEKAGANGAAGKGGNSANKGKGGKGVGGGQGSGVGSGNSSFVGSAICSEGASVKFSSNCWGQGFFGCQNQDMLESMGGMNGAGGALEFYCVGGITRVCLTYENCPWRAGGTKDPEDFPNGYGGSQIDPASMFCAPNGLPINGQEDRAVMARCRGNVDCGFSSLSCDGNGHLFRQ